MIRPIASDRPGLLLTETIAHRHGGQIASRCRDAFDLVLLREGRVPAPSELARVQAAFLSTDLMGASSKAQPNQRLRAFSAAVTGAAALQWLHTCSAGTDRDILQQSMLRGVVVTTSSGANAQAVAHTAIAGLLAMARGVPHWIDAQSRRQWCTQRDERAPRDIDGTHALVVGMGPIGQAIAGVCRALGMRVTGVRRDARPHAGFDRVLSYSEINPVLPSVDWVILACPLSPLTRGLVDTRFIAQLPDTTRIVNVARGECVVDIELRQALDAGDIAGYYSDVFTDEPLPGDSPWWTTRNTLVSAHSGAASTGFPQRTVQMFLDNLERFVHGRALANVASPA